MIELIQQPFIQRALLAGVGLAIPLGVLGCFMLWRRMAFFSDAMAHAALIGVVIGAIVPIPLQLAVIGVSLTAALILSRHRGASVYPLDTWLSAVSYGGLAIGLCLIALYPELRVKPDAILFGEILSITAVDLYWVLAIALITPLIFAFIWRSLLLVTMDEDLAATSGISIQTTQALFLALIALVTAIGLKIIGALLLPALMIFPAAASSRFSRSPEAMAIGSSLIAILSFIIGSLVSFYLDLPTGPVVVITALLIMVVATFSKKG